MTGTALFDNIPRSDHLALHTGGVTDYQRVVELLDFRKKDVARASKLPVESVRYDPPRMPKELVDRINEWAIALNMVAQFFRDERKTVLWFKTPNPLLGDVTPRDMIRIGRARKLLKFISNALSENEAPR